MENEMAEDRTALGNFAGTVLKRDNSSLNLQEKPRSTG
jgi:hypothetical protein